MSKFLVVEADYNDADYVTSITLVTDDELEQIRPIVAVVAANKRDNWPSSEYIRAGEDTLTSMYVDTNKLTQDQVVLFDEFVPRGEYGVHTIVSVEVITKLETLL